MEAQDFYERKVKENPEIETPKLMEELNATKGSVD